MSKIWDYIIVGGGTAGCVLANRLSEDSAAQVLLIEAGKDLPPGEEPDDVKDLYPYGAAYNRAYQWPELDAHFRPLRGSKPGLSKARHYVQARVMGGGSSINGQLANRGTPEDYDEWQALGASGWGWSGVLPYFKKLETDLDFEGPLHGSKGPMPISRLFEDQWPGFSSAAARAFAESGYQNIRDQNGNFEDGWFPMTLSTDRKQRVSAAQAYLDPATRSRANLHIMANTHVNAIEVTQRVVVGVRVNGNVIRGRQTVLAAGTLQSPVLLLRAGIGPADELRSAGIDVVADLRGVGKNLQEHPNLALSAWLAAGSRMGQHPRRHFHVGLRYSSRHPEAPKSDMFMSVVAKSAWHPIGVRVARW